MSHQVGVSGVHKDDTDLNWASVLDLRPLGKSLRVHQGQPPPRGPVDICNGVASQGVVRVKPVEFLRLKD